MSAIDSVLDQSLHDRMLKAVQPPCGPATRAVLRGCARTPLQHRKFEAVLNEMLDKGELKAYGYRYGLPDGK